MDDTESPEVVFPIDWYVVAGQISIRVKHDRVVHFLVVNGQVADGKPYYLPVACHRIEDIDGGGIGDFRQVQAEVGVLDVDQGLDGFCCRRA